MYSDTLNSVCSINEGIEDTGHFVLLCHAYDDDRRDLLNSECDIATPWINKPFKSKFIQNKNTRGSVEIYSGLRTVAVSS